MFNIAPNPVEWYESAINGKMEREFAELLLGTGLSMLITFLISLKKFPLIGGALANMGMAARLNLERYKDGAALKKFSITYPVSTSDTDWIAQFNTIEKDN